MVRLLSERVVVKRAVAIVLSIAMTCTGSIPAIAWSETGEEARVSPYES